MSGFVDASLFEAALPERFGSILDDVDGFMRDVVAARGGDVDAAARLRRSHDGLMERGLGLWPSSGAVDLQSAEAAFVSGALRAVHYEQTVHMADLPIVDTAGSQTLGAFSGDLSGHTAERIRAAIVEAFSPSAVLLAEVDARVAEEAAQLRLRHRLMSALDAAYPLVAGGDNRASVDRLFRAFYPDHPLRSGEVEVIRTATGLFFCVPYDGERLTTRAEPDAAVSAFIRSLTHSHPSLSAHFPSFGSLRAADIPAPLRDVLSSSSGLTESEVSETLPTMVVILPTGKVDQYIVHDAWGHGWQALLFRFEETYQRSARYNRLPRLDERFACVPGPGDTSMREALLALAAAPGALSPWDAFLRAATSARLYDTLGSLNAEVLADVVEYKYLAQNPEHVALMPSSSFVKEYPTKLDLTLLDMPEYYARALQGFRRFAESGGQIPGLIAALGGGAGVTAALEAAAGRTGAWLDGVHGSWPQHVVGEGGLSANTMSRVALNYLEMHALFNRLYAELLLSDPTVRFADLLVFSAAAFLEEDWSRRFWLLDEYLVWFPELLARFRAADIT